MNVTVLSLLSVVVTCTRFLSLALAFNPRQACKMRISADVNIKRESKYILLDVLLCSVTDYF